MKGRLLSPHALIAAALAIATLATGCAREPTYSSDSNLTWEVADNHLFIKASGTLYRSWCISFGWENNDLHYRTACIAGEDLSCISDEVFQRLQSDHIQVLAPTCERIGNCCFQGTTARCVDLSRTKIASLGHHSFANTPNLEEIHLPNSVKSIDVGAFDSTTATIYFYGTREEWDAVEVKAANDILSSIDVVCIGDEMTFDDYSGNAWWRISGETLQIVANGDYVGGAGGTAYPWKRQEDFQHVVVAGSTSYLSAYAFAEQDLKEVTILPSTLVESGMGFFAGSSIERVDLAKTSLIRLGMDFCYQAQIREIFLPATLKQIDLCAFQESTIDTIYFAGTYEQWQSIVIEEANDSLYNTRIVCLADGAVIG